MSLLFSDLEGSTQLWEHHASGMAEALGLHDDLAQRSVQASGGRIVKHTGDGLFAAFDDPLAAVTAAVAFQTELAALDWPEPPGRLHARIGIHTGEVLELGDDVFGPTVNRAARVMDAAWADQIVVTEATVDAAERPTLFEDLGHHRLKGLTRPIRIYQVVSDGRPSDFPPLRSLSGFPNNLPAQLPSMIGRDDVIDAVLTSLESNAVVTLAGPGGMGKTRLALEVAADAGARFKDGVWLVELAPLDRVDLVATAAASALRVPDRPGRTALESITRHVADFEVLVILDNCEHVAAGAAQLASAMATAGDGVRILATSREPLRVGQEHVEEVRPLGVKGTTSPAVQLFVERAAAVKSDFRPTGDELAAINRICERLDGLPLATELAAARVRAMSIGQIESRLDDRFRLLTGGRRDAHDRHSALEATIDWSFDLLTAEQARIFAAMSVFAAPASLEAIEAVLEDPYIVDHLTELADKSLVRVMDADDGTYRYGMYETIRLYASDKVGDTGDRVSLQIRHLRHFAAMARDLGTRLDGREQRMLLPRVVEALPDFRAAMASATDFDRAADGAAIATGLYRYWYLKGVREGRDWLESFAEERHDFDAALRARLLYSLGSLLQVTGEYARSAEILEKAVDLHRDLDNARGLAYSMHYLARAQWGIVSLAEIEAVLEEARAIFAAIGDPVGEGLSHLVLGVLRAELGDVDSAAEHIAVFRKLADEVGAPQLLAHQREFQGVVARLDGRLDEAVPLLLESLGHYRELGNAACSAHWLENAAATLIERDARGAAEILAATNRLRNEIGVPSPPYERLYYDATLERAQRELEAPEFEVAWQTGEALDFTGAMERSRALLEDMPATKLL